MHRTINDGTNDDQIYITALCNKSDHFVGWVQDIMGPFDDGKYNIIVQVNLSISVLQGIGNGWIQFHIDVDRPYIEGRSILIDIVDGKFVVAEEGKENG